MRINEKQKIIVAVLVFTLFTAILAALNYFRFAERGKLLASIDSLQKEEKKANQMIRQIPELRQRRKDLAQIIDQYVSILPPEQHIEHEAFANIIDGYSQDTLVVIQKVEYLNPEVAKGKKKKKKRSGADNFVRHRYRLKLIGEYRNFLRFINKIENHTRFLKIDEILIQPLGSNKDISKVSKDEASTLRMAQVQYKNIELVLSTYTYKKEKEPGGKSK